MDIKDLEKLNLNADVLNDFDKTQKMIDAVANPADLVSKAVVDEIEAINRATDQFTLSAAEKAMADAVNHPAGLASKAVVDEIEAITRATDPFGLIATQKAIDSNPIQDIYQHEHRAKAEKIVREEKQVELLTELLQSNRDAEKKSDIMLVLMIFTVVLTFIGIAFL